MRRKSLLEVNKMSLQIVLEGILEEHRLPFLRKAFRAERQDVAEALLSELESNLRNGSDQKGERREFNEIIEGLIEQAEKVGNSNRATMLRFQHITSYFFADDIGSAAKRSKNPELVEKTINHYRGQYFNKAEMVISLLEHLGQTDQAQEYSLEAAEALRRTNGGVTAVKIYSSLGMFKEAIEVRLDNNNFDGAIQLAQKHLGEEELPQFYQKVFDIAKEKEYDNGFPVQVRIATLLGDEKLERETKKKYVKLVMAGDKTGYLDLIREVGTEEQLTQMHERVVTFYQQDGFYGFTNRWIRIEPKDLAEAAEKAFQDTQQVKYAGIAMNTYEKIGNLPKALEFARIADYKKAEVLEKAVSLITE